MTEKDGEYVPRGPGPGVYFIAIILGAGASFALAAYWLEFSPPWLALLVGAVFGLIGFSIGENIGEAIMLSLIMGVLTGILLSSFPEIAIIRTGVVPAVTGFCAGELVSGIWKETSG
jgi:hypothetical protein